MASPTWLAKLALGTPGPPGADGAAGAPGADGQDGSDLTRDPITVAVVTNITLSGLAQVIQGVAINNVNQRVGVFGQTDGTKGGIYNPRSGAWVRASDMDTSAECVAGMGGLIQQGTYNGGSWTLLTDGATLGTTALSFKVEPFVDVTSADGVALTVASGVPSLTKIGDSHIDTISVGKLASGGSGNNGKVATVVAGIMALAAAVTSLQGKSDVAADVGSPRAALQGQWLDIADSGSAVQARLMARSARMRVRAATATNQATPLSISSTFAGLSGSAALKRNDVVWYGGQTTSAENGPYRVVSVTSGTATMVKLANVGALLTAGLYLQVSAGTTFGGNTYKMVSTGSFALATTMPAVAADMVDFSCVSVDNFVVSGDDTTETTGNWQPIVRRALECMAFTNGVLLFGGSHVYRFTSRVDLLYNTRLQGAHGLNSASNSNQSPRLVFDGCAGFFAPCFGETWDSVTYDTGIRATVDLRGLNISFQNGSTDNHYGLLAHCTTVVRECVFSNPFGDGIKIDTTTGSGGANGSSCYDVLISGAGLNGWFVKGGDANNITLIACRSTNHGARGDVVCAAAVYEAGGTATFPGNDWGLRNESFLGMVVVDCEFSSGHVGGIYDLSAKTSYIKPYTEAGSESDIVGSDVMGGNLVLRTGGNATKLPVSRYNTANSLTVPSLTITDATASQVIGDTSGYRQRFNSAGTESIQEKYNTSGGNVGCATSGWGTANQAQNYFETFSTQALGLGCVGFKRGSFFGFGFHHHALADVRFAMTGAPTLTFADNGGTGDTITRSTGSWITDGVAAGQTVSIGGSASNNISFAPIVSVTATVITLGTTALVNESTVSGCIAIFCKLPVTGVPRTTTPANDFDGSWPVGSEIIEITPGKAACAFKVDTNSGTSAYNLTWRSLPNEGADVVALATGDETIAVTAGGTFHMAASTTAATTTKTLSTVGALKGDVRRWRVLVQAHDVTIDGVTITAGQKAAGRSLFNGSAWVTTLQLML